jgi:hypothetical protein
MILVLRHGAVTKLQRVNDVLRKLIPSSFWPHASVRTWRLSAMAARVAWDKWPTCAWDTKAFIVPTQIFPFLVSVQVFISLCFSLPVLVQFCLYQAPCAIALIAIVLEAHLFIERVLDHLHFELVEVLLLK